MTAIKTLIFSIFVPGSVAGFIPLLLVQGQSVAPFPWALGFIPLGAGVALYLWCASEFTFTGKGTPAPIDAPKYLVVRGPYRWVRNPMYVAVLSAILGEALLFRSWSLVIYALFVFVVVHLFVTLYEEPTLREQFADSYERYTQQVSRWLLRPPRAV